MSYIKRNVNLILLMLIIVIVAGMAGLAAYYQGTYGTLAASYDAKIAELESLSKNLSAQTSKLNETYTELQLRLGEKQRFDVLYTNLSSEKESTEQQLKSIRDELTNTLIQLRSTEAEMRAAKSSLAEAQLTVAAQATKIQDLNSQIASLNSRLSRLCDRLRTYNASDSC